MDEKQIVKFEKIPLAVYFVVGSAVIWLALAVLSPFIKTTGTFIGVFSIILLLASSLGIIELFSEHKNGYKKDVVKNWAIFFYFAGFIVTGILLHMFSKKLPDQTITYKRPFTWKRWYKFNKQRIPLFLSIISVVLFTGLLDFDIPELRFNFKSHFDAITNLYSNNNKSMATFMIFLLNITSIVQSFNTVTFGQKKNPFSVYLITLLMVIELVAFSLYLYAFLVEPSLSPTYQMTNSAKLSIGIFSAGILFGLASTFFAWKYVDWKYVKIEE